MIFVVVLLAGKQLVGIIDIIEIQVQGRCRWMLEIGGILPLLAVDCVTVGGVPVVAGYLAGGVLVRQSRFDDVVPALCDVPFPLPADAVGDFFVERAKGYYVFLYEYLVHSLLGSASAFKCPARKIQRRF